MKSWVKLYSEVLDDPDLGGMTNCQFGLWAKMLALAGRIDDRDQAGEMTGRLDTAPRIAWRLRCSEEEVRDVMRAWCGGTKFAEGADGIVVMVRYAKRQERAPSDAREAVAQRVQRCRERKTEEQEVVTERVQREQAGDVTACNEDVTSLNRGVTASDSDSDSHTEADSDPDTHTEEAAPAGAEKASVGVATDDDQESALAGEPEEVILSLRESFANLTGISAPGEPRTQRQREDLADKWVNPLGTVAKVAGWKVDVGQELMRLAIERLRAKQCHVTCPRSVADTAVAIAGEDAARKAQRLKDAMRINGRFGGRIAGRVAT
jgi:hypothetical protein